MIPSISDSDVFTALRMFLMMMFPSVEVIQAQDNNVPPPKGAFITMNNVGKRRLATNSRSYTDTEDQQTQDTVMPTEYSVQVDFYGEEAGERAQTLSALFFDYVAYDSFPDNIKPLYASDPFQIPLITGEKNYRERWSMDVKIQYNPVISTPMTFFDSASIELTPISSLKE